MKKSKFSDTQIVSILPRSGSWHTGEGSLNVSTGRSVQTCYYKWKSKFRTGLSVSELRRNRRTGSSLNSKLKRMWTPSMAMENHALKDLIEKKL